MSQWTHVNGNIRFDALRGILPKQDKNTLLGVVKENLPCGSEGPILVNLYESPEMSEVAAYSLSIFGDLRDYDNVSEIKEWFLEVLTGWAKGLFVRSAVLEVDVEFRETIILMPVKKEYRIVGVREIGLERQEDGES